MKIISEQEFVEELWKKLYWTPACLANSVTGPGRSGAIAAVYTSHILGIPFLPYGSIPKSELYPILLIDTATESGKTLRKIRRKYWMVPYYSMAIYAEPPRVAFWYEAPKPQRYRKEKK